MGLLNKLFGGSNHEPDIQDLPWNALTDEIQIDNIKQRSEGKTQIIFKHSSRCGISQMVLNRFKKAYDLSENQADLYFLDIIDYRSVSNAIAEIFRVTHESPQLLIIKSDVVVKHDSHSGINTINLDQYI